MKIIFVPHHRDAPEDYSAPGIKPNLGLIDFSRLKKTHEITTCRLTNAAIQAMSLSLLKFVGQASLVDEAMLPS